MAIKYSPMMYSIIRMAKSINFSQITTDLFIRGKYLDSLFCVVEGYCK